MHHIEINTPHLVNDHSWGHPYKHTYNLQIIESRIHLADNIAVTQNMLHTLMHMEVVLLLIYCIDELN